MAPKESSAIRIGHELVRILSAVWRDGGASQWHTEGVKFYDGGFYQDTLSTFERPACIIELTDWVDTQTATMVHIDRLKLTLWLVIDDDQNVERALWNMKRDMLKAVYRGETDAGLKAVAQYGVWPVEFHYRKDLSRAGLAVGELILHADYQSTHEDP